MNCQPSCYETTVNLCGDIVLKAQLAPNTEYVVALSKSISKEYRHHFTTDNQGSLTITKSVFPSGYFAYGFVRVVVRLTGNNFSAQPLTFKSKQYTCVLINLVAIETDDLLNIID